VPHDLRALDERALQVRPLRLRKHDRQLQVRYWVLGDTPDAAQQQQQQLIRKSPCPDQQPRAWGFGIRGLRPVVGQPFRRTQQPDRSCLHACHSTLSAVTDPCCCHSPSLRAGALAPCRTTAPPSTTMRAAGAAPSMASSTTPARMSSSPTASCPSMASATRPTSCGAAAARPASRPPAAAAASPPATWPTATPPMAAAARGAAGAAAAATAAWAALACS
jgi:hypothetical protein